MTTPTDVVTARDSLEWYDHQQIGVARGDAVAIRNGRMIKGDILTVYMKKAAGGQQQKAAAVSSRRPGPARGQPPIAPVSAKSGQPDAGSQISRVDAQGHVVISNGVETGRGDFGVYNSDTGIATLIGDVVIERGQDVLRGQRGIMDLNRHVSRMLPGRAPGPGAAPRRVQGLFVRADQGTATAAAAAHSTGSGGKPAPDKPRKRP